MKNRDDNNYISVGSWMWQMFVTKIPIIGVIMFFWWALTGDNESRKNRMVFDLPALGGWIIGFGCGDRQCPATATMVASNLAQHPSEQNAGHAEIKESNMSRAFPQTPEQLLEELFSIFPAYRAAYDGPFHDDEPTFHSVLMAFDPFISGYAKSCPEKQLRAFGDLINAAVENKDALSNSFDTVLLEHFHQTGMNRIMKPFLSKTARSMVRF